MTEAPGLAFSQITLVVSDLTESLGFYHAIVEDPDGNCVGLMSQIDEGQKYWPPTPAPVV